MTNEFKNRVALVTGASTGIGAATALLLAKKGAAVAVNYAHSQDQAEKIVGEIRAAGGRAIAIQADVTQAEDIARLTDEVHSKLGLVDFLINNAGGLLERVPVRQMSLDLWHRDDGPQSTQRVRGLPDLFAGHGRPALWAHRQRVQHRGP